MKWALLVLVVFGLSGCSTVERPSGRPATPSGRSPEPASYPRWTQAAGWLLMPWTGVSGGVEF